MMFPFDRKSEPLEKNYEIKNSHQNLIFSLVCDISLWACVAPFPRLNFARYSLIRVANTRQTRHVVCDGSDTAQPFNSAEIS